MSLNEEKNFKGSKEFKLGAFRAYVDSTLSILKTMIILNAGALVSILIAASRSVAEGFASAVIGSANFFFWGLILAIFAMVFYSFSSPFSDDLEEGNNVLVLLAALSAFSLGISIVFFIFGSWSTISDLQELFHIE